MATTHCSPGDRVVCKIQNDKVVNIYNEASSETRVFDIITKHNEGYFVYINSGSCIKDTILITSSNYKKYNVDKKFIDCEILFITDHNIFSIYSKIDGMTCIRCKTFSSMASSNQSDGSFVCWNCTMYPFYK